MGYYTFYELTCRPINNNNVKVQKDTMKKIDDYVNSINEGMFDGSNGVWSTYAKWYESSDDMKKISEMFPSVHFILNGDGEDSEDMWVEHWVDGSCQHCQAEISYEKFDINKLKKM